MKPNLSNNCMQIKMPLALVKCSVKGSHVFGQFVGRDVVIFGNRIKANVYMEYVYL